MPAYWKKLFSPDQRASPALGVFAAGLAVGVLAWAIADSRAYQHALAKADFAISDASDAIQSRLYSTFDVVHGAQGLFRASENVSREEFYRYASGLALAQRHPAIRSLNYSELVPAEGLPAFVGKVRNDRSVRPGGYPQFAIKPPGARSEYLPIVYTDSAVTGESAIGLDLLTGDRRESVDRARDTGTPVLSGRMQLTSAAADEAGVSVRLAVYRNGMPTRTVEERREAFAGVVSTTLLTRGLVQDILAHPALAPMSVRLYDRFAISGSEVLGAQPVEYLLFEKAPAEAIAPPGSGRFERNLELEMGGRQWYLQFRGSARDFMTPTDKILPWILLFGAVVMAALLAGLIRSLSSSRVRAQKMAERITEDLRQSEAKLAEAQRLTQSMIEALPNPIFFKSPDGRYRGVNEAWEKFFGISRDAFIGKTVHDLYPNDKPVAERLDARDQELWECPGSQTYEAVIPGAEGTRHDVVYFKATYARTNGAVAGLIGTIIDITERKRAERRQIMEHAITRVLAEADSVAVAIPMIIRTICETMGWHYGDRYEYDAEAVVLRRREFWAVDTPEMQTFATSAAHRAVKPDASGGGLIRAAHSSGKPVWISDICKNASMQRKEFVEQAGLHGAFAFPLIAAGQVLGVVEFFHRDVREPDAMLIHIAESIGSQIGQFIVRMQAEEAVKFVAMHDSLTNLPNRVMFNQRLEQAITQAHRNSRTLAVMFIDLDRFKIINDTLGHEAGDVLLREVAQRITHHLRTGDMVARLGGDEFVVLLEDQSDPAAIGVVAEKLITSLTENFVVSEREVHVTASIGISTYPADAQDMRSLMKFADIAMYRAKEQGRNTFQFYSDQIDVHSVERLTLESELRGALERNELVLHYQPVVEAKSGSVVGMEALVRWQRGEELLAPGKFIGIAEESGLIVPIGEWVLETACAQQRKWREQGLPPVRIAVNLSPRQFMHRKLVEDIVGVIGRTGCDTSLLELEITESTVMHNAPRAVAILTELKAMGIRVAIDDFGTGYSSLAYLKRFPIDSLKVDRSFVSDVPSDSANTAITRAIIAMAHSLGLNVIAEGVETLDQLNFLREHGCDELQGYYMSMPLAEPQATAMLETSAAAQKAQNVTALDPSRRRR